MDRRRCNLRRPGQSPERSKMNNPPATTSDYRPGWAFLRVQVQPDRAARPPEGVSG